ncbi:MAG: hypothetical protein HYZ53_20895 [Planctomycetes bacterium]|nr:hypothetical protein [Planctomycetota bacterium]
MLTIHGITNPWEVRTMREGMADLDLQLGVNCFSCLFSGLRQDGQCTHERQRRAARAREEERKRVNAALKAAGVEGHLK